VRLTAGLAEVVEMTDTCAVRGRVTDVVTVGSDQSPTESINQDLLTLQLASVKSFSMVKNFTGRCTDGQF